MRVRLACVKPAASVRSEPGSNSQVENLILAIFGLVIAQAPTKGRTITITLLHH